MKDCKMLQALLSTVCFLALNGQMLSAQEKAAPSATQAHVVITDMALRSDSELPRLRLDEVKVKQGKTFLQVTQLFPAQGDNAALQLTRSTQGSEATSMTLRNSSRPNHLRQ